MSDLKSPWVSTVHMFLFPYQIRLAQQDFRVFVVSGAGGDGTDCNGEYRQVREHNGKRLQPGLVQFDAGKQPCIVSIAGRWFWLDILERFSGNADHSAMWRHPSQGQTPQGQIGTNVSRDLCTEAIWGQRNIFSKLCGRLFRGTFTSWYCLLPSGGCPYWNCNSHQFYKILQV